MAQRNYQPRLNWGWPKKATKSTETEAEAELKKAKAKAKKASVAQKAAEADAKAAKAKAEAEADARKDAEAKAAKAKAKAKQAKADAKAATDKADQVEAALKSLGGKAKHFAPQPRQAPPGSVDPDAFIQGLTSLVRFMDDGTVDQHLVGLSAEVEAQAARQSGEDLKRLRLVFVGSDNQAYADALDAAKTGSAEPKVFEVKMTKGGKPAVKKGIVSTIREEVDPAKIKAAKKKGYLNKW